MGKNIILREDQLEDLLKGLISAYSGNITQNLVDKTLLQSSEPKSSSKSEGGSLVDEKFPEITKTIIDKLEGGYYHPKFQTEGAFSTSGKRLPPSGFRAMGRSGETMFGIDRLHGGSINTSLSGSRFWKMIDFAQEKETWPYNYKGGVLRNQLTQFVTDIMKDQYNKNAKNYLSSKARKIVESDPKLLFNFAYASWNGPGYFKKYATKVNQSVEMGETDPSNLDSMVYSMRTRKSDKIKGASEMLA
jgi:hypothetical protein